MPPSLPADSTPKSVRVSPPSRIAASILGLLAVLVLTLPGYRAYARWELGREAQRGPRDPETGVLAGTEAITLPGDGDRAVLLIHGFAGSRRDFNDLGELLNAQGYTVRLLRLPGHGSSPEAYAHVTASDLLDHVRQEHAALAATHRQVDLIGFSMGGSLATLLAAELSDSTPSRPDSTTTRANAFDVRPPHLVLIAPYYGVTHQWYYILHPTIWQRILSPLFPYVVKSSHFVKLEKRENARHLRTYRVVPAPAIDVAESLGRSAASPTTLSKLTGPVLILHAAGDEAADPRASRRAFSHMTSTPKRHYHTYTRSNHLLLWDHDQHLAKTHILEFLTTPID